MSNTTTTSTTTINPNSPSNFTVALDADNKIIWSSENNTFVVGEFSMDGCDEATTFVIGNVVKNSAKGINAAFSNHSKVKSVMVYNSDMINMVKQGFNTVGLYDEETDTIRNKSGEIVTISVLDNENYIFDLYKANRDITEPLRPSDFGVHSYDTGAINLAILFVTTYGGKLVFEKEQEYYITGPLRICPVEKDENNTNIRNFEINFNDCKITPYFGMSKHKRFDETDEKKNTVIYVNAGFADEERIGIIQNVEVDIRDKYRIHTGMYLDSSSQISYKNIKITNPERGIYINRVNDKMNYTNEVFMDDITITKSLDDNGDLVYEDYPVIGENETFNEKTYYPDCKYIGLDCDANDCHFSNITVEDYLIGVRILGGDNRIKNAVVKNEHSQNLRRYSVGYINGSGNYYINCKVNDEECDVKEFYIGWMSEYAVPFFLNGCKWYGDGITSEAYAFYIKPDNYSGGGIYASGCSMTGSKVDNELFVNFCNVDDYDINYLGTTSNIKTKEEVSA